MPTVIQGTTGTSIGGDATVTGNLTVTGNQTVNGNLTVTGTLFGGVPSGAVFWFAANAAPIGYLEASGAAVSRTTYAALFAVIGTTFGSGDGSTTFNLPDLRGEFIRGWDNGRGVDPARVFGSAQNDQMQAHQHTGSVISSTNGVAAAGGALYVAVTGTSAVGNPTVSTGGTPRIGSETRPRNIALLPCIKT
jgi:phage-related tail fiber protein